MMKKLRLGIFSGSKQGRDPALVGQVSNIGASIPTDKVTVVYGGGDAGLMRVIPEAFACRGGEVIGIDCTMFTDKFGISNLGHQVVCPTFQRRQNMLIDESEAYLCLPGGVGTLSELMDVLVRNDLGLHSPPKPIILFNYDNMYSHLVFSLFQTMEEAGFLKKSSDPPTVLSRLGLVVCTSSDHVLSTLSSLMETLSSADRADRRTDGSAVI